MSRVDRGGERKCPGRALLIGIIVGIIAAASAASASSLKVSSNSDQRLASEVEADYTTSHVFVDEIARSRVPITVFFDPGLMGVEVAEVFTNLNRRERATADADGDGVEDGIKPPPGNVVGSDDRHYFKAYPMQPTPGGYRLTLEATKTGAYRLTARYRLVGDAPGVYRWYGAEANGQGILKRDHAIVVSPVKARDLRLYEANPLTVLATGTGARQRGTVTDLATGLTVPGGPRFSLAYMKRLGVNALWLQPIHPRGIAGREIDPKTRQTFVLGSPYATKNFFAAMPLLAKGFAPGATPAANDSEAGREQAMADLHRFVTAADAAGIDVVFDAPFNHAAPDVELAPPGRRYWGNNAANPSTQIRNVEARVFSDNAAYDKRARDAASVSAAPDRYDFGKWNDVVDIYFGRYAALVPNGSQRQSFVDEGDWFDYSVGAEDRSGDGNGHFDAITQGVWKYFGDYLQHWLTQTGYPDNPAGAAIDSNAGIDGLRADFAQGLPPQCWEYLVNRTRARKWNFVFMAESLDGGPVTYRSARHFDVLNDRILYDLHQVRDTSAFRRVYDDRRASYGLALVLLNTASHDEDSYRDPYEALLRYAVNATIDGMPMIFSGQELGLRGTIVPPRDSDPAAGPPFGYERYDAPFFGKPVPAFKTYNSMMPLWRLNPKVGPPARLTSLYSGINEARSKSAALRSENRFYLNLRNGTPHEQIFSVAKFERRNASPADQDVVLAFVNLNQGGEVSTPQGNWFNVNVDWDRDGVNDFGIVADRFYNVKNLAAFTGVDPNRRNKWVWDAPRSGEDILQSGIFVRLNRVPVNDGNWGSAPYEPQYLKLFDVTHDVMLPH